MTPAQLREKGLSWPGDDTPTPITRQMMRRWCREEGVRDHRIYGSPSDGQTWMEFLEAKWAEEDN